MIYFPGHTANFKYLKKYVISIILNNSKNEMRTVIYKE